MERSLTCGAWSAFYFRFRLQTRFWRVTTNTHVSRQTTEGHLRSGASPATSSSLRGCSHSSDSKWFPGCPGTVRSCSCGQNREPQEGQLPSSGCRLVPSAAPSPSPALLGAAAMLASSSANTGTSRSFSAVVAWV